MSRLSTGKVALFIILASESVFFATLLVAYAALRGQNNWPMTHSFGRLTIPLLNTMILVMSAVPARRAILSIRAGKQSALLTWLVITLLLGLVFVTGQVYEFGHAGLHINDQAFGGVFFTLMGFHALHVLAGVVFLVINLVRARLNDFSSNEYNPIELGSWFWYYVIAVWLVLFAALYLL
jgi:cytochrome c oxidase subunit 3